MIDEEEERRRKKVGVSTDALDAHARFRGIADGAVRLSQFVHLTLEKEEEEGEEKKEEEEEER